MNAVSEFQKRRAENIIWNAAGDYSFQPDFKAYDAEGRAELYWNCVIGAVRRQYEYPKLEKLFASFQAYEDADEYEGLLWLGLENGVYERERAARPVLSRLRREYAERYLALHPHAERDDFRLLDSLSCGHYLRVLGREPRMDRSDLRLLDELEFPPELDTDGIVLRAQALFEQWFRIRAEERKREKKPPELFRRRPKTRPAGRYRPFGAGFADHPKSIYGGRGDGQEEHETLRTSLSAEELRAFMAAKYGKALLTPEQARALERELCTDSHARCHLHLTDGERIGGRIQNGFEALHRALAFLKSFVVYPPHSYATVT